MILLTLSNANSFITAKQHNMKHKIILPIIYLTLYGLLISCNAHNTTNITTNDNLYIINIDSAKVFNTLRYSDIFKSVKVITLSNKETLIGQIDKIQPYKDKLYILDSNIAKGVFEFNKNGDFIRKIGSLGSGPGEYISCQDFAINEKKEEILIQDAYNSRIYIYDIQSGKYKSYIDIQEKNKIEHIWINDGNLYGVDSYFIGNGKKTYHILQQINETTGSIIAEWMEADKYNKGWNDEFIHTPLFYPIDKDKDLFAFGLCDSIMCIQKDKLYPYIVLTGKNRIQNGEIPQEMISSSANANIRNQKNNEFFYKFLTQNKFIYISYIFEHNNYIYIDYSTILFKQHIRYNKTNKETHIYKSLEDNLLYSKIPKSHSILPFATSDSKGIYSVLQTENLPELKYFAQEEGTISSCIINKNKLKEINEDSNPIILYYEFK